MIYYHFFPSTDMDSKEQTPSSRILKEMFYADPFNINSIQNYHTPFFCSQILTFFDLASNFAFLFDFLDFDIYC